MGNILSSFLLPLSSNDNIISSSLLSKQLIHRHTLSTCYDAIFDISLTTSTKINSILISDDGRLRLFHINFDDNNNSQLIETNVVTTKILTHEQILDILWSIELNQYLVLTSKRLTTYDQENNLINLNLNLEKGSPPLWRMACWSNHLILNLGLGSSIRYYNLRKTTSTVSLIHSYTRSSLGYTNSDLLSSISLSPQLILGINIELSNNRHVIDLFSISDPLKFFHLKRIDQPCPLDIITSLRNCTWLCKSHWPSDDCLCLIESDGHVKKIQLEEEQNGYILNLRLTSDRSHIILIRTPKKLPKEIDQNDLNRIDRDEEEQTKHGRRKQVIGKLPGNLLLEIYKIPLEWK